MRVTTTRTPTTTDVSFVRRLFLKTSIDAMRAEAPKSKLRRVLRARDLIAVGLGTMIGGGIFTTIGPGVKLAGPAIIVAFLLAGLASFFAALSYAELGAMVPIAGSAYTYAYATLGQVVAWIIGFALLFEYGISAAPVAQQFSSAFQGALTSAGIVLPFWARTSHFVFRGAWWSVAQWDPAHSQYDVIGALFVLALSALLVVGIRETATTNNIFVVLKISALVVFVIAGIKLFHPANLSPFVPQGWGSLKPFSGGGGRGIIPAAALVFFSYIGFDTATTTAEECRRPQRDVPVGVMGALGIGTVIYCVVAVMLVGIVPWQKVDQNAALASAIAPLHNPFVSWTITMGVIAGTTSVALASLLGQTRIFYVMSRDRMLPPFVSKIHPRFKTPARMTMITGVGVAILTLVVPLDALLNLVNIGTLSAFIVVCAGVIWLRYKRPDIPRAFRAPFVPVFPAIGIFLSLALIVFGLSRDTLIWFVGSLTVGLIIYFAYGFRKSRPDRAVPATEP
ncbi:MAG: amino acid permease [Candidatus Eremiobacteraeota bacterium]|nr:amino acid permease [Candidatus Eremiobacteraeota bacterium]